MFVDAFYECPLDRCRCCASWLYPRPSSEEMSIAEKNLSFAHERLSKSYLIPQKYFWGAKWLLEPKRTQVVSQGIPGINALSAFSQDNWIIFNFVTKRKIYFWNHVLFFTIYVLLFWFMSSQLGQSVWFKLFACLSSIYGKARMLAEWADGLLIEMLDGLDGWVEWIPLRLL